MSQTSQDKTNSSNGLVGMIVIIVICALIYFLMPKNKNLDTMASVQCKNYVRDSIKSPSTAKFTTPMITDLGNSSFEVIAYVDAENSFGAAVRNLFVCKVHYAGGDEGVQSNWTLMELTFSE